LSIVRNKDRFTFLRGRDGQQLATSLSDAAQHVYNAYGKEWRRHVAQKRDSRRRQRADEEQHAFKTSERDRAWPYSPPDLEGLAFMHAHTLHGDRSRKKTTGKRKAQAAEV
jgi:hypothetical protein